jgi:hypothetical protein
VQVAYTNWPPGLSSGSRPTNNCHCRAVSSATA